MSAGGCRHCVLCFLREPDRDEVRFRVEIVIAGLVHNPDIPLARGPLVCDDLIDLANFQILTRMPIPWFTQ